MSEDQSGSSSTKRPPRIDPACVVFVVASDLHFGDDETSRHKVGQPDRVAAAMAASMGVAPDAIIANGDLTDHGFDGKRCLCWRVGGPRDELGEFRRDWLAPMDRLLAGAPPGDGTFSATAATSRGPGDGGARRITRLNVGNHDGYTTRTRRPAYQLVERRHGGLRYAFTVRKPAGSLMFVCLHEYPDAASLRFLRRQLAGAPAGQATVVYFHYNLQGPMSDWWSAAEKDAFAAALVGHNIVAILVGHLHLSYAEEWRGHRVVSGAGDVMAMCTYDPRDGSLGVDFF